MKMYQLNKDVGMRYEREVEKIIRLGVIKNHTIENVHKLQLEELDEREIILLLALKLGMNWSETNTTLEKYGYGKLYAKEIGDVFWIYSVINKIGIMELLQRMKKISRE